MNLLNKIIGLVLIAGTVYAGQPVTDAGTRYFTEVADDPAAIADNGAVYTKEVSGITELFYGDSTGGVVQITSGGAIPASSLADVLKITTTKNLYVATTGSDTSNDCTVISAPCATIQKAVTEAGNYAASTAVVVNIADGAYSENITVPQNFIGFLKIIGDSVTPANVTVSAASASSPIFTINRKQQAVWFDGLKLQGATAAEAINSDGANIYIGYVQFYNNLGHIEIANGYLELMNGYTDSTFNSNNITNSSAIYLRRFVDFYSYQDLTLANTETGIFGVNSIGYIYGNVNMTLIPSLTTIGINLAAYATLQIYGDTLIDGQAIAGGGYQYGVRLSSSSTLLLTSPSDTFEVKNLHTGIDLSNNSSLGGSAGTITYTTCTNNIITDSTSSANGPIVGTATISATETMVGADYRFFKLDQSTPQTIVGSVAYNGTLNTTNVKTSDTLGTTITTDGGLEIWSTGSTLTNWTDDVGGPGSPTLAQESGVGNVYSGTYSAKFTTDAATDAGRYITQEYTGLTVGDYYRAKFYAKESTGTATFSIIYLNGVLGVATQVFHFTGASAGTWVNGTGVGGVVDPMVDIGATSTDIQTLTNTFAQKTASMDVPVPANGIISYVISAQGAGGVALDLYLDAVTFQKVTYGVAANLFDLKSSQDPASYTVSDSIFKIENTGGAGYTWLQLKGDGGLYVDGIDTNGVVTQGIESGTGNDIDINMGDDAGANVISFENLSGVEKLKINSLGNIYAPTNKALIIGVDNQGTADAEGVGITLQADDGGSGGTGNHNGGDIRIDLGTQAGSGNLGKVVLQHNGSSVFGRLYSDTGGRLIISGNESSGISAVAVTLGATADYTHAGSKLLSIVDNLGAGSSEKLAVDYTGAVVWPQYATGVLKSLNGDAGTNNPGGDMYIIAGKSGSLTTGSYGGTVVIQAGDADGAGNNNGGSVQLDVGSPSGTGSYGSIGFSAATSSFGFVYKHPTATVPIWAGNANDGASAVGLIVGPAKEFTTTGSKLISIANYVGNAGGTEKFYVDKDGSYQAQGRELGLQGTDVASANDITLGLGNYFDITGTTETQRILGTGWTAGSIVTLQFDASVTIKHGTAAGGGYYGFQLAASGDFSATAGDTLMLIFDGAWWREISRTAI